MVRQVGPSSCLHFPETTTAEHNSPQHGTYFESNVFCELCLALMLCLRRMVQTETWPGSDERDRSLPQSPELMCEGPVSAQGVSGEADQERRSFVRMITRSASGHFDQFPPMSPGVGCRLG